MPGQDSGSLVELALKVMPFPLAELFRRRVEDPPGGRAVVHLQGRGRRHHVRPVPLLAGGVALGHGNPPLPDDPRQPDHSDHQHGRRQASLVRSAPGPLPHSHPNADRPGQDRLPGKETAQVIGQASAVAYRLSGCFSRHFRQMVSRSRGM